MRKFVSALALGAGFAVATSASAQVSDLGLVQVDNSGEAALAGFVSNSVQIDFAGEFTGAQLLLNLETGSIYRDALGSANGSPPSPAFIGIAPSLAFDSYFGNPTADVSAGAGAVDLGGNAAASWAPPAGNTAAPFTLNQAWNPPGGLAPNGGDDFETYRVSLSDDANGSFSYLASANSQLFRFEGLVENGVLVPIPEPTTAGLLGLGALALVARRRKA